MFAENFYIKIHIICNKSEFSFRLRTVWKLIKTVWCRHDRKKVAKELPWIVSHLKIWKLFFVRCPLAVSSLCSKTPFASPIVVCIPTNDLMMAETRIFPGIFSYIFFVTFLFLIVNFITAILWKQMKSRFCERKEQFVSPSFYTSTSLSTEVHSTTCFIPYFYNTFNISAL